MFLREGRRTFPALLSLTRVSVPCTHLADGGMWDGESLRPTETALLLSYPAQSCPAREALSPAQNWSLLPEKRY